MTFNSSRNIFLRGARITKRGKHVVSYNAAVGRMAVGAVLGAAALTVSSVTRLLLPAAGLLAFSGLMASAANECGGATGDTVVCDAASYGAIVYGHTAEGWPRIIEFNNPATTAGAITFTGSTEGVDIELRLLNFDQITYTGTNQGTAIRNGVGSTLVRMESGTIFTSYAGQTDGLYALGDGSGRTSRIVFNGGTIDLRQEGIAWRSVTGIWAASNNGASSAGEINGGEISLLINPTSFVERGSIIGAVVQVRSGIPESTAAAQLDMTAGVVEVIGSNRIGWVIEAAHGLRTNNQASGASIVNVTGGTINVGRPADDNGASSMLVSGVSAESSLASNSGGSQINMSGGEVSVNAVASNGLRATHGGVAFANIVASGTARVSAVGTGANGALASITQAAASYSVEVKDSASVIGGGGAGIRTESVADSSGTITIGAGATVDGSAGMGIVDLAGNTTATINGTLLGNVDMGAGNDIFVIGTLGSVPGVIDGGDGNDTIRLSSIWNTNNGGNPAAEKFLNFEIFEFANEALNFVAGQVTQISNSVLVDSLAIQSGATTQVSANISSLGNVVIDGDLNVTSNATVEAVTLSGVGNINVSDLQTVTLDVQSDSTFAGTISGNTSGAFEKTGSGNLTLTGTSTINGGIAVKEGALSVNGSVCGDLTVDQGATLKGSGTVCDVASNGTLAPGNSPGTLTSIGDIALNGTSVLELDIDGRTYDAAGGAGSYDRIVLTDATSTFTAGGTLTPILRGITGAANNNFDPVYGDIFTVVTTANANGIVGTFGAVSQPTSGLPNNARVDVLYGANQIDLVITPDSYEALAAGMGGVSNYVSFGRALDAIRPQAGANPATAAQDFFSTELYPLNGSQLTAAMAPLSGGIHAFALGDMQQYAQNMVGSRHLGGLQPQADGSRVWGNVSGSRQSYDPDALALSFDSDLASLVVGVDLEQSANLRYGIALGHGRSDLEVGAAGSAENDLTMVTGYYARQIGGFTFGGKLGLGWGSTDTQRSATLATGTHSATGSGDTTLALVSLNAEHQHELPKGMDGRIWADLSVIYTDADAYTETGSSQIAASVQGMSNVAGALTLGYEVTTSMQPEVENSPLALTLGFGVRHAFGDDRTNARNLTMHGAEWSVSNPAVDPTSLFATIDVAYDLGEGKALSASVIGMGNGDYSNVGAALNFVSRF